jgi:hypothetical protein
VKIKDLQKEGLDFINTTVDYMRTVISDPKFKEIKEQARIDGDFNLIPY